MIIKKAKKEINKLKFLSINYTFFSIFNFNYCYIEYFSSQLKQNFHTL